jgi:hypothetical protein
MIGDRSGTVHVADKQVMDLIREEIDLPFNCYVYFDGFLGLAPMPSVVITPPASTVTLATLKVM